MPGPGPSVVLGLAHISKTFPGTRALDDVSFDVRRGEFHALLGGNGSGKSTLIKILAGVYHADAGGMITVDGHTVDAERTSPEDARAAGLHFVHQNPAVFPALSIAENMAIGHGFERGVAGRIDWKALRRRTSALLERFDIPGRPDTLVRDLRPAERAMVAIARALQDQEGEEAGLLVLDEPTASLPRAEVVRLLGALTRYARDGQTILFVSHRLDEVVDTADRATVLRDGRVAGTVEGDEITEDRLIELIAGRPLEHVYPEMPEVADAEVVLDVRHLAGGPLVDVSFQVRRGDVLGVAGLLGSGRSELLKMLFGAYRVRSGEIVLDGRPVRFRHIGDAMRAGIAYVPEDRGGEAAFPNMTVTENMTAALVDRYWRGALLRHRAEDADTRAGMLEFGVRAASEHQELALLSGGNQQKVILARWLLRRPRLLLLDEPTQGVDVNARAEIYHLVRQAVADGCAVIVVTSDFEELAHVSDRVVVLNQGRVTAELRAPDISATRLTELAYTMREVAS
ncbi:MAG TPA: sugar ABC transporter ATP-binding protein [Acidimicrobiales bacterium]|nr:sugar ABC transporter ATP-binding protein [Acidimicrobiales bacterium]